MKHTIKHFIASCEAYKRNKPDRKSPAGLLKSLEIPFGKWKVVTMDFFTGLSVSPNRNNSVFVIVDKFSKMGHFVPVKSTATALKIAHAFHEYV